MSVRQMVQKIQTELRSGEVSPARSRELLMTLTSLLGNCNVELQRTEGMYTAVLARELDAEKKANRARIRAEMTPEYAAKQEARNTVTLVTEMIRSLKLCIRSVQDEMRLTQ